MKYLSTKFELSQIFQIFFSKYVHNYFTVAGVLNNFPNLLGNTLQLSQKYLKQ